MKLLSFSGARSHAALYALLDWTLVTLMVAFISSPALAQVDNCWSNPTDTPASGGFVCVKLSEALLLNLRGAPEEDVEHAMGVPGRVSPAGRLQFISSYNNDSGAGSGQVAFSFGPDQRVVDIDATVSGGPSNPIIVFIWTADGASCSDFPGSSSRRCDQ